MKYELLNGTHNGPGGGMAGASTMYVKVEGKPGPYIETAQDLEEMFPGKFRRVYKEEEMELTQPVREGAFPLMGQQQAVPGLVTAAPAGDDVTEKFDVAVANDLKVYHGDDGYTVVGDEKELVKGIKTIPQVKRWLKAYTEDDDDGDSGSHASK